MNIQEIETLLKEVESKVKQIEKLISHYGTAYPVAKDELDIMKERQFGARKGTRKRAAAQKFGFQLDSQRIAMTDDSD